MNMFLLLTLWKAVNEAYCEKKKKHKKTTKEVILVVRATYMLNLHELKIIAFAHHLKERSNLLLKDWSENTSGIWMNVIFYEKS